MGSLQMGLHLSLFCTLLFLSHLAFLCSASEAPPPRQPPPPPPPDSCPRFFNCGTLRSVKFPFMDSKYSPRCVMFPITCNESRPKINLGEEKWYDVIGITQDSTVTIRDSELDAIIHNQRCDQLNNLNFPNSSAVSFIPLDLITLFKCHSTGESGHFFNSTYGRQMGCNGFNLYYKYPHDSGSAPATLPPSCSMIQLPASQETQSNADDLFALLTGEISLQVNVSRQCHRCHHRRHGICGTDARQEFVCLDARKGSVHNKIKRIVLGAGAGAALGIVLFICFLSYYNKKSSSSLDFLKMKRTTPNDRMIETFLRQHGSMAPRRYRYSELKKFTNSFRHELGKGGYGRVYKGSLPNNRPVAVKVLNESKRNGEEFVNEVASIGRTSHVNIVSLLGFCYEGRKSALVYEFMPNKSLENFINYDKPVSGNHQLGCEKLIEIATGIACGLEYLHRGCNTPILHLDIKPHNILLDWDFCPKISDFGLSKLCLGKDNVVSMSEARGTIGYIAPEVFNRSFGVVSHKSDVYSYGMMVLEMVGGRHNVDIGVVRSSETYFPHWIYMRLELDNDLKLPGFRSDTENETARKMIIVGLWCIQTNPSQRPSMSKVLEMLEGSIETLQIPPKPFLYSPPRSVADSSCQVEIYG